MLSSPLTERRLLDREALAMLRRLIYAPSREELSALTGK
jgi:hypothetical protein